jgi:hypothetical protein
MPGLQGASAYEVAVVNGFDGTDIEWLASLRGPTEPPGAPAETVPAAITGYCDRAKLNVADGRLVAYITKGSDLVVYWQLGSASTNFGCEGGWLFVPETQPMPAVAAITIGSSRMWNAEKQYLRTGIAEWKLGPDGKWGVRAAIESYYELWGKGVVSGQYPWMWKPEDMLTITIPIP